MKLKLVKTVILLTITAMLMLLVTSCGSSGASEQQSSEMQQTTTEETVTQEQSTAASDTTDIGEDKVKQIVLDKVPGAVEDSIYEFEREYDDGRLEYEGSLYHNGYEYEFEIDGATGNILKWEIDD